MSFEDRNPFKKADGVTIVAIGRASFSNSLVIIITAHPTLWRASLIDDLLGVFHLIPWGIDTVLTSLSLCLSREAEI